MGALTLFTYFRSSAAYRVRIALELKGLAYDAIPVHLLRDGGEHHRAPYTQIHPLELVPALQDDALVLTQSLAILEYLEELQPTPPLLPDTRAGRARVRSIALTIACDIHPLNNLRVLQYLQRDLGIDELQRNAWYQRWLRDGLTALERMLSTPARSDLYCHGDTPTLADCCLIPQVFNALRFHAPLEEYPTVMAVYQRCQVLGAFQRAAPEAQPDAA
jgi:maleylacetoacetate isomerase/maleylpyruvate isomerase